MRHLEHDAGAGCLEQESWTAPRAAKRLDLNLILALNALLTTRSVSRASERLFVTQPAMSATLGRLRRHFDDELLMKVGRHMVRTAFAETLLPIAAEVLRNVETLLTTSPGFDPGTSQRRFRIATSDYVSLVVLVPLLRRLARTAPRVVIQIVAPSSNSPAALEACELDMLISPHGFLAQQQPTRLLFEEEHVVVGWRENPLLAGELTKADFLAAGHVAVTIGSRGEMVFAERELERLELRRRVEISASSFLAVPWMLPNTMRLAVMHARLARAMIPAVPLRFVALPFDFPKMRQMMQFHRTREFDPGMTWLCDQLRSAAELGASISGDDGQA